MSVNIDIITYAQRYRYATPGRSCILASFVRMGPSSARIFLLSTGMGKARFRREWRCVLQEGSRFLSFPFASFIWEGRCGKTEGRRNAPLGGGLSNATKFSEDTVLPGYLAWFPLPLAFSGLLMATGGRLSFRGLGAIMTPKRVGSARVGQPRHHERKE